MKQTPHRTAADRRAALWIAALAAVLLALFLLSFVLGRYDVPIRQVVRILLSGVFPIEETWTANMTVAVLLVTAVRKKTPCIAFSRNLFNLI